MSPSRTILLVGEGNFSYSSSLCKSEAGNSVTATCLQHEEEALRHEGAAANIQSIKDAGGTVLFEVDCTKLDECGPLRGRAFDRVVFNFPHCGRKSGVKKNRELLKNFFLSCVGVLAEDGEVHVSLCNGQGGTPADRPKREWHNSWQVTAMAAEANLILRSISPFESENHSSYKRTGYRSQDKGFHVEKALLHVFSRSVPYAPVETVPMEEVVEGQKVHYNLPAELSHFGFRSFLCSDSVHPVKLVQDFLLKQLSTKWTVSMLIETVPFLVSTNQLQGCCHGVEHSQCYWVNQTDLTSHAKEKDLGILHSDDSFTASSCTSEKVNRTRSKPTETSRPACADDSNPQGAFYLLRPSLLPQLQDLLPDKGDLFENGQLNTKDEEINTSSEVKGTIIDETCEGANSDSCKLIGICGVVFRNVPISLWTLPAFHEFLLRGVFSPEDDPVKLLGHELETLLMPYGVSVVIAEGGLHLMAHPMGVCGKVFTSEPFDSSSHIIVNISINLDLLAALLFSITDWRLLWSHDPRFAQQYSVHPPPGTPFRPLSLFPEPYSFDISFWTGPTWEEKIFLATVREASLWTVEQAKLIDMFSHPDLSQTSYCYRLVYRSHTHALSHTQALKFHKQLEVLLSSRLQVTIR